MEVLTAVLFLAAATVVHSDFFCPKIQEVDWEIELLLPHRECNKFYQCTHGKPVEMSCPEGLYFSIIKRECTWRIYVECGDRIIPIETEATSEKEGGIKDIPEEIVETVTPDFPVVNVFPNGCPVDPKVHSLLPHKTYCNLFYYCVEGVREIRRCPFGLNFNRELQVCDWPRNAGCYQRLQYEEWE